MLYLRFIDLYAFKRMVREKKIRVINVHRFEAKLQVLAIAKKGS